jgi:hypothetical protein
MHCEPHGIPGDIPKACLTLVPLSTGEPPYRYLADTHERADPQPAIWKEFSYTAFNLLANNPRAQ